MYYFVFSRVRISDGKFEDTHEYVGTSKSEAIDHFSAVTTRLFKVDACQQILYFVGFNADAPVIKNVSTSMKDTIENLNKNIPTIISNIDSAVFVNIATASGYSHKFVYTTNCEECNVTEAIVKKNVYGDYLCPDCWSKYIISRKGLAEYLIGIANDEYRLESFTVDTNDNDLVGSDLDLMVRAWTHPVIGTEDKSNRELLLESGWTEEALNNIERIISEKTNGKYFLFNDNTAGGDGGAGAPDSGNSNGNQEPGDIEPEPGN